MSNNGNDNDQNAFHYENNDNTLFNNNYDIYNIESINNNICYNKKPKFNIDLFEGVREELEKDTNSNNLYLNFYNKHTRDKVLQDLTDTNKKYYDINMEQIKEKEYKYKKKKEEEEKIRKKKEKEDTNEYRKEQMLKLYSNELNKYKKHLNSNNKYMNIKPKLYDNYNSKNNNKNVISKSKPKVEIKPKRQVTYKEPMKKRDYSCPKRIIENKYNSNRNYKMTDYNSNKKEEMANKKTEKHNKIIPKGNTVVMTQKEYDKTIKELKEKAKMYINDLDKLKANGKSIQAFEKEIELSQLIDKIRRDIDKFQSKLGIKIIDN
jgi:hypothetical protein